MTAVRALAASAESNARPHLDACAKSPIPTRGAARLADKPLVGALALAAVMTDAVHPEDRGTVPIWCAEQGIAVGTTPYLLWRNIAAGSRSVDRIMPMTIGPPVFFESIASPHVQKILSEIQQNGGKVYVKGALHQIMSFDGTKETVFAFFDGRPDGDTLAHLADDIRAGKAGFLASFDSSTKTISVSP